MIGASSDVRERLSSLVGPLKSMFSAMFFVSIGLLVDPAGLWANKTAILVVSLAVVVGKLFNVTFASLLAGVDVRTAVQNGFSLAQIGEFAFMVAILYAGIVGDAECPMFQIAVGASLLTTLLNPWMIRLSGPVGDFAERHLPARFRVLHDAYRAWLAKIGASEDRCDFGENVDVITAIESSRAEELSTVVSEISYGKGKITLLRTEERASKLG